MSKEEKRGGKRWNRNASSMSRNRIWSKKRSKAGASSVKKPNAVPAACASRNPS
jgi:hypothetical protein